MLPLKIVGMGCLGAVEVWTGTPEQQHHRMGGVKMWQVKEGLLGGPRGLIKIFMRQA